MGRLLGADPRERFHERCERGSSQGGRPTAPQQNEKRPAHTGRSFFILSILQTFAGIGFADFLAMSTRRSKTLGSFTAISLSILRLSRMPDIFRPLMNRL